MRYERIEVDWRDSRFQAASYAAEPDLSVEQAEAEAAFIGAATAAHPGELVLDLGCGPGLHALAMARYGMRVVALDQSSQYLSDVLERTGARGLSLDVVTADIEALPCKGAFDLVYMLRNPFHFHKPVEHVLSGVALSMREDARFAVAFYNRKHSREVLPEVHWQTTEDGFLLQRKEIDEAGVFWETDIVIDRTVGEITEYVWWTQCYSLGDAELLLEKSGLRAEGIFGGFQGEPWAEDARIIMLVGHRC